jgi:hypothetical protein
MVELQVSLTVRQLQRKLEIMVRADPRYADLLVKLAQYDDPTSNETGESSASEVVGYPKNRVIIK